MKKIIFFIFCFCALFADSSNIDELFDKVSIPRKGLEQKQVDILRNPFVSLKTETEIIQVGKDIEQKPQLFIIKAIVNHKVKIDEKWYGENDTFSDNYLIQKIGSNHIVIKKPDDENETKLNLRINNNVTLNK